MCVEEAEKVPKKRNVYIILLFIIILLQTVYVCLCFAYERKGIFSDEVWCYGLANSHNKPFIYAPDGFMANYVEENDISDNFNEIVQGSELRDYITVQKGERFDYGSVYHNQSLDFHPVLYYLILNTVCSFFPDTFSLLFAFIPSIIFLCITQIFLYKTSECITDSKLFGLGVCLLYAVVPASMFTFIYLRMYSLLTMLLVMNTYFTMRFIKSGEISLKNLLPVFITAFLAFNTQYSSIVYIGCMTAALCIYLVFKKGFCNAAGYGLLMSGTLLLFAAVFPAVYEQTFNAPLSGEKQYDFSTQLRGIIGYITKYSLGFHVRMYRTSWIYYVIAVVVVLIVLAVPVIFLLRDTKAVKTFITNVKESAGKLPQAVKNCHFYPVMIFAGVCGLVLFVNISCDVSNTLDGTVRYLMPCYPFVCLLALLLVRLVAGHLPIVKKIAAPVIAVMIAVVGVRTNMESRSVFMYDLFPTTVTEAADIFEGTKNVVVIPEKRFIMTNTCAYLYKCESAYYVTAEDMKADPLPVQSAYEKPDYVWVELENYFITEKQRAQLVDKGILNDEVANNIKLRSDLEADTEHKLFTDKKREKIIDEETEMITGAEPEIELMIEANGRLFYVLKCR